MSASTNDKITDVRNGSRPNTATVTTARSINGTNLACNDLSGWPTASKIHFVIYQIDTNSNPVAGTQLDCSGIVSGNTITQLSVLDGTDGGSAIGDVVEMLPTASWAQDLSDALIAGHERDGSHSAAGAASVGEYLYPVGSIYINASVATNPATLLGFGTWTAFGGGRVPVGNGTSDATYTAGSTGGESTHTLTTGEMPTHGMYFSLHGDEAGSPLRSPSATGGTYTGNLIGAYRTPGSVLGGASSYANNSWSWGSNTPHNILQPYIVVYMWKRTA